MPKCFKVRRFFDFVCLCVCVFSMLNILTRSGLPSDLSSGFGVALYDDDKDGRDRGARYGEPVANLEAKLFASPSLQQPDIEFTVTNWSQAPGLSQATAQGWAIRVAAFAGSFVDGGIGEGNFLRCCVPLVERG